MMQIAVARVVFLFPLAYSPGPGNMFFAATRAPFGFKATISANVGYHFATWFVTTALGFGFIAALEQFSHLFNVLKIAGSFYVFWIAWKLFRAGALDGDEAAKTATFTDGVELLVLNPSCPIFC